MRLPSSFFCLKKQDRSMDFYKFNDLLRQQSVENGAINYQYRYFIGAIYPT